jgi:hypothetical protein
MKIGTQYASRYIRKKGERNSHGASLVPRDTRPERGRLIEAGPLAPGSGCE